MCKGPPTQQSKHMLSSGYQWHLRTSHYLSGVCVCTCVFVCVCACVLCVCACMCMSFQFHIYTCMYINYMVTYNKNFTSEASRHNPHHWHHFRRQRHISEPHIQCQPPYCLFMVWITKTTCTIDKPSDAHLN